jgi:hypothetical protein
MLARMKYIKKVPLTRSAYKPTSGLQFMSSNSFENTDNILKRELDKDPQLEREYTCTEIT